MSKNLSKVFNIKTLDTLALWTEKACAFHLMTVAIYPVALVASNKFAPKSVIAETTLAIWNKILETPNTQLAAAICIPIGTLCLATYYNGKRSTETIVNRLMDTSTSAYCYPEDAGANVVSLFHRNK